MPTPGPTTDPLHAGTATSISDAEAHDMEVLWQRHPLSTESVAQALQGRQAWKLATIKTLLGRLLAKGAVSATREGRRFLYSPVLTQQAWLQTQSLSLVDRWFGGRLAPLVAQFASHRPLKPADVEALRLLLKEHDGA